MRIGIVLLAVLLSACASMQSTPIRSDLEVHEYNDISRQYMDRPTYVSISGSKGNQRLKLSFDPYGIAGAGDYAMFSAKYSDTYIELIEKYLNWNDLATKEGDILDKKIGSGPIYTGLSLEFSFFSSNESSHYLVLTLCSLGSCAMGMNDSRSLYFTKADAATLLDLIKKLKSGELPGDDVGAKYN